MYDGVGGGGEGGGGLKVSALDCGARSLPRNIRSCLLSENAGALIASLKSPRVKSMLEEFVVQSFQENVNFMFWWNYMELVSIDRKSVV